MRQLKRALAMLIALQMSIGVAAAAMELPPEYTSIDVPPGVTGVEPEEPLPEEPAEEVDPPLKSMIPASALRIMAPKRSIIEQFGDGSDGALVIKSGDTVVLPVPVPYVSVVEKNYTSINIESGGVLKCAEPNAGLVLRVQGDVTIKGTIDQSGKAPLTNNSNRFDYPPELKSGNGGSGGGNFGGYGGGTGQSARPYGGGYSGGGVGGTGAYCTPGNGGSVNNLTTAVPISDLFKGSPGVKATNNSANGLWGGGSAGVSNSGSWATSGGDGGTGAGADGISASNNGNGYSGGGGAGNIGGGVVIIYADTVNLANTYAPAIACNGGNGGNGGRGFSYKESGEDAYGGGGGGGGGGAGGGSVYIMYKRSITNKSTIEVNGGKGGTNGTCPPRGDTHYNSKPGIDGTDGTVTIKRVPDYTPPTISKVITPTAWGTSNTASIVATDDMSNVTEYAYSTTNATPSTGWQPSNTFTITVNGTYYAFAKDGVGNISAGKSFSIAFVDNTKPVVSAVTMPPVWVQGNNTVSVVASDTGGSGVAAYAMTTTNTATDADWNTSPTFTVNANGTYYYWAKDNMGLVSNSYRVDVAKVPYTVGVVASEHGAVVADRSLAIAGDTVMLTILPETGYRLKAGTLRQNGTAISGSSFTMPSTNVSITAEFEMVSYSIAITPSVHGTVAADRTTATYGERVELSISIDLGYKLKNGGLRVNGAAIAGTSFNMPPEDIIITAEFEPSIFEIIVAPMPRAVVTTDKTFATVGEPVNVTVTPNIGYRLKAGTLKVNGIEIADNEFLMPASVATITAEFEPIEYNITIASVEHGAITASKTTATIGEAVRITVTPSSGYRLVTGSLKVNGMTTGTTFIMGAADAVISAQFEAIVYDVVARSTPNGYVNADKTTAIVGELVNISVIPVMGYRLRAGSLKVNGDPITDGSFTMPSATVVISAEFEPIRYTITVAATPNGTVTTDKAMAIIGETVKITVAPKQGYKLIEGSIKVNGRTSGINFVMTADNSMVTAQFEPLIYTVQLVQSPNGTVTADRVEAVIGDTVKLTVTPDRGYRLKANTLKVDGKAIVDSRFVMAAGNTTVTVEFEAVHYTVTVGKTPNGTITPNKATAIIGEQVNIIVAADSGYKLVPGSVKVNGNTVGNSFIMGAQNVIVTGEFEPITYNLTIQQTPNGTVIADKATAVIGDTVTLTVTPDRGYRLMAGSLKVNGTAISGSSFVMTSANALVRAEFEAISAAGTVKDSKGVGLQGMTVTIIADSELITATDKDGKYSFLTVPNGTYTLKASHYRWDTAQAQLIIKDGYIKDASVLNLTCNRDGRLDILEELIRSLPEPLENGSNDAKITADAKNIRYAKTLYDELPTEIKAQLDIILKNKLDRLLVRLAVIESLVNSNLEGVTADGLEGVVDKGKIVSVDGEPTNKITIVLDLQTTDKPEAIDQAVIEELTGRGRIGTYLDINLHLQVDNREPTQITETLQPVTLQLPIPSSMSGGSGYRVVRVHNGVAQYLDTEINEENILVFSTDKFSTYAIEYSPRRGGGGGGGGGGGSPSITEPTPEVVPNPAKPYLPQVVVPLPQAPAKLPTEPTLPQVKPADSKVQAIPLVPTFSDISPSAPGLWQKLLQLLASPFAFGLLLLMLWLSIAINIILLRRGSCLRLPVAANIALPWDDAPDAVGITSPWQDEDWDVVVSELGVTAESDLHKPEGVEEVGEIPELLESTEPELMADYDDLADVPQDESNDEFDDDEGEFYYES